MEVFGIVPGSLKLSQMEVLIILSIIRFCKKLLTKGHKMGLRRARRSLISDLQRDEKLSPGGSET